MMFVLCFFGGTLDPMMFRTESPIGLSRPGEWTLSLDRFPPLERTVMVSRRIELVGLLVKSTFRLLA